MRMIRVASVVVLGCVALSGCTFSGPDAPEEPASDATSAPEKTTKPSPTPVLNDGEGVPGCSTLSEIIIPSVAEGQTESMVTWNGVEPVDNGVSESAQGVVTMTEDGRIASYTVAEGDSPLAVGERLCISIYTYTWYNHLGGSLQPGDVLVLGPGTMTPGEYVRFDNSDQRG